MSRTHCPACCSKNIDKILEIPFREKSIRTYIENFYSEQGRIQYDNIIDDEFIVDCCNDCGLFFQRRILAPHLMTSLYEVWIDPKIAFNVEERYSDLELYSIYAQEVMTIIRYFDVHPRDLNFLDFGMGWGRWARMAAAFGVNCFGWEISENKIVHAQKYGVKPFVGTGAEKFHFINCEQVFEHIPNPLEQLESLGRSLTADGLIRISVPNGHGTRRRLETLDWNAPKFAKNSLNPISPLEHINCFDLRSLIKMAEQAGFLVEKISYPLQIELANNWTPGKVLLNLIKPAVRNGRLRFLVKNFPNKIKSIALFFRKDKT